MSYTFGWHNDPAAVWSVVRTMERDGLPAVFSEAAPHLLAGDDDKSVFFWDAEKAVLSRIVPAFNQRSVGACVGFGYARGTQDLTLWEIAAGEAEEWPGAEIAPEPIYAGSRVEVGGGRLQGDGSVGAWAATFVNKWGVLARKVYGPHDLTRYDEGQCRRWGDRGVPDDLEPEARKHPVTATAMVRSAADVWAAVGAGKPVVICSDVGFDSPRRDGFCEVRGSWAHCMTVRGRFTHPSRGRCFVIGNSWGDYLGSGGADLQTTDRGAVVVPDGCFAVTWEATDRIARQEDSWSLAGMAGWKKTTVDHTP